MTDEQHAAISKRNFDVLSFIVRRGIVFRMDRQSDTYSVLDNIPGLLARKSSAQVAMGRHVIVMEEGSLKPDLSRLTAPGFHALDTIPEQDYIKFFKGVESMRGVPHAEFRAHLRRSYPSFVR